MQRIFFFRLICTWLSLSTIPFLYALLKEEKKDITFPTKEKFAVISILLFKLLNLLFENDCCSSTFTFWDELHFLGIRLRIQLNSLIGLTIYHWDVWCLWFWGHLWLIGAKINQLNWSLQSVCGVLRLYLGCSFLKEQQNIFSYCLKTFSFSFFL